MFLSRRLLSCALACLPAFGLCADWPQQSVTIVMTFPAGSGVRVKSRLRL